MAHHNRGTPYLPALLLLLVTVRCVESQPSAVPPSNNDYSAGFSVTTAVIFVALIIVFFLLAFFSIYLHRCTDSYTSSGSSVVTVAATGGRERRRGLDSAVVESFPTMQYAAAKELKGGKGGAALECAVCLSEFADDDTLRLLPGCCHVFHPECIGGWLASHVTCPVCRADLSDPAVLDDGIRLTGEEKAEEEEIGGGEVDLGMVPAAVELAFRRTQSAVDGVDRFTLRLPEHVRKEMEEVGRLRRASSFAIYPLEGRRSERRGGGGGEGSARRSGRWRLFLRTISGRRTREEAGSEVSDKQVFPLNGAPVTGDRSASAIGETEASDMAVLNRV
ncbi:E3 ubiquitin-protein ligase ATL31-like [Typha latifolia]|uniref:E3 ubiquitin-protein ligase ATL31-like n=1 Tax=Typha latifolia TaxID=4733 RepID=UPI003C2AD3DF